MEKFTYSVEVRDENRKPYMDVNGNTVARFKEEIPVTDVGVIKRYCEGLYRTYKAIAKVGSTVDIEVSSLNKNSGTYMCLYSLYDHKDNTEFIKH